MYLFMIQRKASQSARRVSPKAEASGDEGMDVDLDNFMTLDSVGDVDGKLNDNMSPRPRFIKRQSHSVCLLLLQD